MHDFGHAATGGRKPELSFRQIWNMCFGFFGIQFGFALQNADVSRIFQSLGAHMDQLPILWAAAPLTGLIVQPIIGHWSDRTWTRLGRRRPYFISGALLATLALVLMPNATTLWIAAGALWLMDGSINISMEPFRAFVGDQLPERQRPLGFAMQSFFIGAGAVVASVLPWVLTQTGVSNTAPAGQIPETVHIAFYVGAIVLFGSVFWTVLRSREYPPRQLEAFARQYPAAGRIDLSRSWVPGVVLLCLGSLALIANAWLRWGPQLCLLGGALAASGALFVWLRFTRSRGMLRQIMADLYAMPQAMRQLAWVQFFSWFGLFAMWIYATPAVAAVQFGSIDPQSSGYNAGANWVGVLFGAYSAFAALAAVLISWMARRLGLRWTHLVNLVLAGAGLMSFLIIHDPRWLLLSMVGVGFGWASILALPYTLLSDSVPPRKMGVYMGIFNFFIVIPQLVASVVLGPVVRVFFHGRAVDVLVMGGLSLLLAGLLTLRVRESAEACT